MATSREDISGWFDQGKKQGATYLLVVCDTFDHEDYPVYVNSDDDCLNEYERLHGPNMQKVMEVYDLQREKQPQLTEHRAMHLPKRAGSGDGPR